MPRSLGDRQGCPICRDDDREHIERLLTVGLPYGEVRQKVDNRFSLRTIERHSQGCMDLNPKTVLRLVNEAEKEIKEVPEDLLSYGLLKLVNAVERLEALAQETGSIKAEQALLGSLDTLLRYESKQVPKDLKEAITREWTIKRLYDQRPTVVFNMTSLEDECSTGKDLESFEEIDPRLS